MRASALTAAHDTTSQRHNKKNKRGVVGGWEAGFYAAPPDRRLAFAFLANHTLQEARRLQKGGAGALTSEFYRVLPRALSKMLAGGDAGTRKVCFVGWWRCLASVHCNHTKNEPKNHSIK